MTWLYVTNYIRSKSEHFTFNYLSIVNLENLENSKLCLVIWIERIVRFCLFGFRKNRKINCNTSVTNSGLGTDQSVSVDCRFPFDRPSLQVFFPGTSACPHLCRVLANLSRELLDWSIIILDLSVAQKVNSNPSCICSWLHQSEKLDQ